MAIRIKQINDFDSVRFVELLNGVFEHSSWVAERAYLLRPFSSRSNLYEAMVNIVRRASPAQRIELLNRYPELAGKLAASVSLTSTSQREQANAGLNHCSADELDRIDELNQAYRSKFAFPFIIAVNGLHRSKIIAAMEQRLKGEVETEIAIALSEVEKIASIRLNALIDE